MTLVIQGTLYRKAMVKPTQDTLLSTMRFLARRSDTSTCGKRVRKRQERLIDQTSCNANTKVGPGSGRSVGTGTLYLYVSRGGPESGSLSGAPQTYP